MEVHILKTHQIDPPYKRFWVVFNQKRRLIGKPRESKKSLVARFMKLEPKTSSTVTYKGLCSPSVAAMTISDIMRGGDATPINMEAKPT